MRRHSLRRYRFILLLSAALAPAGFGLSTAGADDWTNLTGTKTVRGEMLGMWNDRVLLQLEGGRRVAVRMEDLRAESRIQAEKRFAEINQRLQQTRDVIQAIAQEAEAPAPQEPAELPAPPSYTPPEPGEDLRTTLIAVRDQTLAGHPRVFYDTLPESHQQLLDELVTAALAKIDTGSFESARSTVEALADLVVTRQRWLLSYPRFAQLSETQQEGILDTANLLRAVAAEDVLGLANLRSRPFAESVAILSDAVSPHLYRLASENSAMLSMLSPDFEVQAGNDGTMVAKTVLPMVGATNSTTYVQVEGRWVAGENAEAAASRWKDLQQLLEPIPDDSLRLPAAAQTLIERLDTAIAGLRQAATRQAFHRALDELLPDLVEVINEWADYQPPRRDGYVNQYAPGSGFPMDEEPAMEEAGMMEPADTPP